MKVMEDIHALFGVAGEAQSFGHFSQDVERLLKTPVRQFGQGAAQVGASGQGRLIGAAVEGDSLLVILGAVFNPLPGWLDGSPLDNPDRTAAFMLQRYRAEGLGFLDGVSGSFVLALWDSNAGRFILANDPAGMRTAYFLETEAGFAFSTTLYALNCATEKGLEIDRSLEDFLLGYEFLPWGQTLYRGVRSMGKGAMLVWCDGRLTQHASRQADCSAWRFENLVGAGATEEQAGDVLFDLFMRCLGDVLPTDKRVAVLLGGFDSALIVAACRALGKEVDAYTFRFSNERYNQSHVEQLARACGATHHWVDITPDTLEFGLGMYPVWFNQPSGMPHYLVQTAHVLRRMREDGHRHCLTGDGCDEIFLGYPSVFRRAQWFQRHGPAPAWMRKAGLWVLGRRFVEDHMGHAARFIRNFLAISGRPMPRRGHVSNRILDEYALRNLRKDVPRQAVDPETILAALSMDLGGLSPLRLAYHGKSMPGLNKTKLAGISSVSGLTVLSPFQHPDLVAFAKSLPESLLRSSSENSSNGKLLLMRTVDRKALLSREVIYQRKASPVAGMADQWYMGPLKELMLRLVNTLPFDFDRQTVQRMLAFKPIEHLFRLRISLGHYVLNAPALLATYATFNDERRRRCDTSRK